MNEVTQEPIHSEERTTQGGALEGLYAPSHGVYYPLLSFLTQ